LQGSQQRRGKLLQQGFGQQLLLLLLRGWCRLFTSATRRLSCLLFLLRILLLLLVLPVQGLG
jgi:hypothetical protein